MFSVFVLFCAALGLASLRLATRVVACCVSVRRRRCDTKRPARGLVQDRCAGIRFDRVVMKPGPGEPGGSEPPVSLLAPRPRSKAHVGASRSSWLTVAWRGFSRQAEQEGKRLMTRRPLRHSIVRRQSLPFGLGLWRDTEAQPGRHRDLISVRFCSVRVRSRLLSLERRVRRRRAGQRGVGRWIVVGF